MNQPLEVQNFNLVQQLQQKIPPTQVLFHEHVMSQKLFLIFHENSNKKKFSSLCGQDENMKSETDGSTDV